MTEAVTAMTRLKEWVTSFGGAPYSSSDPIRGR
jgi:hypothetical protein